MGFEINTYDKKVFNQLSNGATFADNTAFFDETFTANPEKIRIQADYEFTWFAGADPYSWNIQAGLIESIAQDFLSAGFAVGQIFEFYNDWAIRETDTAEFTATIDTIQNGGTLITFTVQSGTQTTFGATESNCGIWADATEELNNMPALFVSFGMPVNSEPDSFNSLLDNSLQRYYIMNLLDTGAQSLTYSTPTIGQYSGQMTAEVTTATGKNAKRIQIKHDIIINPFWLETDTPAVLINPPNDDVKDIYSVDNVRFAGLECLRYVQEIELRATFTSLTGRRKRIYLDGNTGWFQDNFNSGSKQFELHEDSVIFNSGASTGLVFGQSNDIQFDLKATDGTDIPPNSPFAVYFSVLPPSSRYQNRSTTFVENFVYDSAVNDEGAAIVAGENGLFSAVSGVLTTIATIEMIRVTATLDLTGTQAEYNDNFIVWAGCETPNSNISDVSCNQVAQSGGAGITNLTIALDPAGGVLTFDVEAYKIPDKVEIIHNAVKKATTSMLSVNNGGSFDPNNDSTSYPSSAWYIGASAGTPPTFYADFEAATGITTLPLTLGYQQRIWWIYTPADYAVATSVTVRMTGVGGTSWKIKRICEE